MPDPPEPEDEVYQTLLASVIFLVTLLLLVASLVLIWFSTLRENEVFWSNTGGYPIILRDLVYITFYPLLIGTIFCLSGTTLVCLFKVCESIRFYILESILLTLCWGLIILSIYLSFNNDLNQLLEHLNSQNQSRIPSQ
jgi:hypothetical protein